jgi:hypothetical protein
VEQLLLQIEGNLPLNSLYIDLTNDEKVENDTRVSEKQTFELLDQLLSGCKNYGEREEMLGRLLIAEPFSEYKEAIEDRYRGGE